MGVPSQEADSGRPSTKLWLRSDFENAKITPNQLRWSPFVMPHDTEEVTFVQGLKTVCGAGR